MHNILLLLTAHFCGIFKPAPYFVTVPGL